MCPLLRRYSSVALTLIRQCLSRLSSTPSPARIPWIVYVFQLRGAALLGQSLLLASSAFDSDSATSYLGLALRCATGITMLLAPSMCLRGLWWALPPLMAAWGHYAEQYVLRPAGWRVSFFTESPSCSGCAQGLGWTVSLLLGLPEVIAMWCILWRFATCLCCNSPGTVRNMCSCPGRLRRVGLAALVLLAAFSAGLHLLCARGYTLAFHI